MLRFKAKLLFYLSDEKKPIDEKICIEKSIISIYNKSRVLDSALRKNDLFDDM